MFQIILKSHFALISFSQICMSLYRIILTVTTLMETYLYKKKDDKNTYDYYVHSNKETTKNNVYDSTVSVHVNFFLT